MKIKPPPPTPNPYPSRLRILRRKTRVFLAGVIVLILVAIPLISKKLKDKITQETLDAVAFTTEILQSPLDKIWYIYQNAKSLADLDRETEELRIENRFLKQSLLITNQLALENKTLKEYLNVPYTENVGRITAQVLSVPKSGLHQTLVIGAGLKDGVSPGQAVIDLYGIVGRIETAGDRVSRVHLLTDNQSRIPVYLPRTDQRAILAGKGSRQGFLVYLEKIKEIQEGDLVLTSGLGGIFPQGLPVGRIAHMTGSNITVQPFFALDSVSYLQVLKVDNRSLDEIAP